jgi:O-antigen/teichoic acid export membrane protein
MNNLRQRTLVGLGWNGAARLLGQLLQLCATVILARLLSPKEYGLLGMVLVFTGFAAYFADMGLAASIIQKTTVTERHLNSVFWLNVATGTVLTAVFALTAPLVARFYDEPQLRLLTVAIALNFFLGSLNVVQAALLDKALNFRAKFWIETASYISSGDRGSGVGIQRCGCVEPGRAIAHPDAGSGGDDVGTIILAPRAYRSISPRSRI